MVGGAAGRMGGGVSGGGVCGGSGGRGAYHTQLRVMEAGSVGGGGLQNMRCRAVIGCGGGGGGFGGGGKKGA